MAGSWSTVPRSGSSRECDDRSLPAFCPFRLATKARCLGYGTIASPLLCRGRSEPEATMPREPVTVSRRDLLSLIGAVSGSAAMYHAMTALGFAADSGYKGPIRLEGDVKGASVLVLGAGLAGMTAALELRKAGYHVQILEFNSRAGGRNWTLRGGDTFTELGGFRQTCEFEQGLY